MYTNKFWDLGSNSSKEYQPFKRINSQKYLSVFPINHVSQLANTNQASFLARPLEGAVSSFFVPDDSGFFAQAGARSGSYR